MVRHDAGWCTMVMDVVDWCCLIHNSVRLCWMARNDSVWCGVVCYGARCAE